MKTPKFEDVFATCWLVGVTGIVLLMAGAFFS